MKKKLKKGSSRVGLDVFFYDDQRNIFEHHKLHHHVPVAKIWTFMDFCVRMWKTDSATMT